MESKQEETNPIKFNLNENQKQFCRNFVTKDFFGNGLESYIHAYSIDISKKGGYESAKSSASRLLTDEEILKYINHLLDEAGLNDQFVDKQLLLLITQNADFGSKTRAIGEYNKLRKRITEKVEHSGEVNFNVDPFKKLRENSDEGK